jgi:hypothetical protein
VYYDIAELLLPCNKCPQKWHPVIFEFLAQVTLFPERRQGKFIASILNLLNTAHSSFLALGCCAELISAQVLAPEAIAQIGEVALGRVSQAEASFDRACVVSCLLGLVPVLGADFHEALFGQLAAFTAWIETANLQLLMLLDALHLQLARIGDIPREVVLEIIGRFPPPQVVQYFDDCVEQLLRLEMEGDDVQLAILQALARFFCLRPLLRNNFEISVELLHEMKGRFLGLMERGTISPDELLASLGPDEMNGWRLDQVAQTV